MEESKEYCESNVESEQAELLENELDISPSKSILKKEEEATTSHDLLRQILIRKGIPKNTSVDELVPDSPKGILSHDEMFGGSQNETILENPDHLVPVQSEASKFNEDEIAIMTGKKTRR
jgi:hypothetical protein